MFEPAIKWSGSKRKQAERIISYFPKEIETYYEPFCGGASVLKRLMLSDIKVKRYVCSDVCKPLIELWQLIKTKPDELCDFYENEIKKFIADKEYFYEVRKRFNANQNPHDFSFLLRTCANGLPRFNMEGNFNTPVHKGRDGILPDTLRSIYHAWSKQLNQNSVEFIQQSFEKIETTENDFLYLDPPYPSIKKMYYYGHINYPLFWDWLRDQKAKYALSFDGISGDMDCTSNVPMDVYSKHEYLSIGISSFKKLTYTSTSDTVYESLYLK